MADTFKVTETSIDTLYGPFQFYCFNWGKHEEDNTLVLKKGENTQNVLLRVQSACYTAEIFRSLDCDCHEQLEHSLKKLSIEGGMLIYMLCDGRGAGIYNKVMGLELGRKKGLDTSDAYRELGLDQDPREYSRVAKIIKHFNIHSVRLLTNNPRKINGLKNYGITVRRNSLIIQPTQHSASYLETKRKKMGHLLGDMDIRLIDNLSIKEANMLSKKDLGRIIVECLRQNSGKATLVEISKYIWENYEMELRQSGNLFYTWQYDYRWQATALRKKGILKQVNGRSSYWELS